MKEISDFEETGGELDAGADFSLIKTKRKHRS